MEKKNQSATNNNQKFLLQINKVGVQPEMRYADSVDELSDFIENNSDKMIVVSVVFHI